MAKNTKAVVKDAPKAETAKFGVKHELVKKIRPQKTKKTSRGK